MLRTSKLVFLITLHAAASLYAQATPAQAGAVEQDLSIPVVVKGHPFSAVRYTRTVFVQQNGRRLLKAQTHLLALARDKDGRILLSGAEQEQPCDLPGLGKLPPCDLRYLSLFEPANATMWHWVEGEIADLTQLTQMDLTQDQVTEAERLTSVISTPLLTARPLEPGVRLEDLGERTFGGIRARGFRVATIHADAATGGTRQTIHEVWLSPEMRLVLRVVDGDPAGEETVSGLDHISLSPDPTVFQPPPGRTVRHWPDSSKYAAVDLAWLGHWEVK